MKNGTDSTSTKYSVFFLKNAQHNTKSLEVYLERRDFTVQAASEVEIGIKKINEAQPGYVFAAWDHVDSSIQNIMSRIPEDIVVIPYITSTSNSDTRKLTTLDVPLKMFPPLTGPAIQRLILKYEKEKHFFKSQNQSLESYKIDSSQDGTTFVSKGERFKESSPVISSRLPKDEQGLAVFESITDLSLEKPTAQFSEHMHVKISEGQKQALEITFDTKIKEDLIEIIETVKETTTPDHKQSIYCMLIQSIDCSGLILLNTAWNINAEDAESAISSWANELTFQYHKNEGIKNIYQSEVFSVNAPSDLDVIEVCNTKSSLQKEILVDGKNTVMAFFDLQYNPFNLERVDNSYLSVDYNCIKEASTITFDLFFQLKENKKMLKMFKKDSEISNKELNSVSQKKILPLLISISDEILWFKYGVEVYLKKL
jgi:hypothetical protein